MGAPGISDLFLVGVDILRTTVSAKTKKIFAHIGSVVGETTDADNVEWIQHVGLASLPPKPKAGKAAAQGYGVRQGGIDFILGSQDLRGMKLYGELGPGETSLYGAGEDGDAQGRVIIKKDGSVTMFTRKGNTEGGVGMMIQLDAMSGAIRLVNDKGYGLIIDADGVKLTSKDAALSLEGSGKASLIGKGQTQVDGASVLIGSVAVPVVNSAITGPAGIVGKASIKVLIE